MSADRLLGRHGLAVVNVGLAGFADDLRAAPGASVTHLDWRPPTTDPATARDLAALFTDPRVDRANAVALARFVAAEPALVAVAPAHEVIDALGPGERRMLHAGPPIAWDEMCGPMQGAVIGAAMAERWADTPDAAARLAETGAIDLAPCHDHGAVGPMAGVISPSMPVWVVEEQVSSRRSFSSLNEGLGKALRFGAHEQAVIDRLHWMSAELGPLLAAALASDDGLPGGYGGGHGGGQAGSGSGLPLKPLMAQALHMGDEAHNRNAAATGQLLKKLAAPLVRSGAPSDAVARVMAFIAGNDHFFLNLSMAACKAMLGAAEGVEHSCVVTAMARNGVRFGIRTSATGDRWFEAPATQVDGLYFAGYGPQDAAADLGDSAITETAGLGGFAMACAPAIVQFVGGTPAEALRHSLRMREVCAGENPSFTMPPLGFASTSALIDVRRVVDTGVAPIINTGIAHRLAGVGQIGAGITHAPHACFVQAVKAIEQLLRPSRVHP